MDDNDSSTRATIGIGKEDSKGDKSDKSDKDTTEVSKTQSGLLREKNKKQNKNLRRDEDKRLAEAIDAKLRELITEFAAKKKQKEDVKGHLIEKRFLEYLKSISNEPKTTEVLAKFDSAEEGVKDLSFVPLSKATTIPTLKDELSINISLDLLDLCLRHLSNLNVSNSKSPQDEKKRNKGWLKSFQHWCESEHDLACR